MPLFRRDAPSPAAEPASARAESLRAPTADRADRSGYGGRGGRGQEPPSVIAQGAVIEGQITGSAELRIEGEVRGKIELDGRAVVAPSGVVRGELVARVVHVAGKVYGDIRGIERVELGDSGRLEGDIVAPRVAIAEGAFFKGKVEMTGQAAGGAGKIPAPGGAAARTDPTDRTEQRTEPTPRGGRLPLEAPE